MKTSMVLPMGKKQNCVFIVSYIKSKNIVLALQVFLYPMLHAAFPSKFENVKSIKKSENPSYRPYGKIPTENTLYSRSYKNKKSNRF
jgi:hypothetical protein